MSGIDVMTLALAKKYTDLSISGSGGGGLSKYSETITGDGAATVFPIQHDLGTYDIIVCISDAATNAVVVTSVQTADENNINVSFAISPVSGRTFRVVVAG